METDSYAKNQVNICKRLGKKSGKLKLTDWRMDWQTDRVQTYSPLRLRGLTTKPCPCTSSVTQCNLIPYTTFIAPGSSHIYFFLLLNYVRSTVFGNLRFSEKIYSIFISHMLSFLFMQQLPPNLFYFDQPYTIISIFTSYTTNWIVCFKSNFITLWPSSRRNSRIDVRKW